MGLTTHRSHSLTSTMGPALPVFFLVALLSHAPCISISVDRETTQDFNAKRPLGPLGPISPYSPTYLPLYRPVIFQPRLICSSCSCSDDFWCASYCPECATDSYCASCSCLSSLACRDKCDRCKAPESAPTSCVASGGPGQGRNCIFPFTYLGVKYKGCAPLYGGLTNAYSPVYWCSTKVDINGFHIRGPFSKPGKYVGYCDHTCPKVNFVF